ncbi:MAG: glycine cleavage system aminomethyltransferase GcvT [Hyphomicrobiaceae bacterium]|nr:glycine cleavage system aminomethyltransferase GcvT [Hyphomicrobiaceae bacterium]
MSEDDLLETPLAGLHRAAGARMVPFAGYHMPVQYEGIIAEHLWTREKAGLFDVSHMGIVDLIAHDGRAETAARALEALVPADIAALKPGRQRYTQFLNEAGGILDDLMVARPAEHADRLTLVVNAACKREDIALMESRLADAVDIVPREDLALIALQGPQAEAVLAAHDPVVAAMPFMGVGRARIAGVELGLTRSGYTGEDGYELAVPADRVAQVWQALTGDERVKPIGLGARDSLRLEAGLCLYGHDLDTTTTPVEADLLWSIQKRRRTEGGFAGFERIRSDIENGPARRRVGFRIEGRAPAREGAEVVAGGKTVGILTSGGFAPSLGAPIAMGYVDSDHAGEGTAVEIMVRGRALAATVAPMPFVPHGYKR